MADNILQHPQFDKIAAALEADRGLPAGTLRAVAKQESNGNPNALSNKGAQGAYQFIPQTAKAYNVDVRNPWDSMRGAADYLGDNMKKYGRIEAALADYNGGPSQAQAVLKNGNPTYAETQNYVTRIMKNIGNAVVPSANASEAAPQQQQPAVVTEELKAMAASKIAAAKKAGVSDEDIIAGLVKTAPPAIAAVVTKNLNNGIAPSAIIGGMSGIQSTQAQKPAVEEAEPSLAQQAIEGAKNLGLGIVRGGRDLIDGPAFLLPKAIQKGAQFIGADGVAKWAGDEAARVSNINKDAEEQYQAATPGSVAAGTGRVIGNVAPMLIPGVGAAKASAAPSAAATVLPKTLLARTGQNAAAGAAYGAAGTRTEDDSLLNNTAMGAVMGPIGGEVVRRVAAPLGNAVKAGTQRVIDATKEFGYKPTAAQIVNATEGSPNWLKTGIEQLDNYVPGGGSRARQQLEEDVANKVNAPIGVNGGIAREKYSALPNAYEKFNAQTEKLLVPMDNAVGQAGINDARAVYQATNSPSSKVTDFLNNVESRYAPTRVEPPVPLTDLQAAAQRARATVAANETALATAQGSPMAANATQAELDILSKALREAEQHNASVAAFAPEAATATKPVLTAAQKSKEELLAEIRARGAARKQGADKLAQMKAKLEQTITPEALAEQEAALARQNAINAKTANTKAINAQNAIDNQFAINPKLPANDIHANISKAIDTGKKNTFDLDAIRSVIAQKTAELESVLAANKADPVMVAQRLQAVAEAKKALDIANASVSGFKGPTTQTSMQPFKNVEQQAEEAANRSQQAHQFGDVIGGNTYGKVAELLNKSGDAALTPELIAMRAGAKDITSRQDFAKALAEQIGKRKSPSADQLMAATKSTKHAPADLVKMAETIRDIRGLNNPSVMQNIAKYAGLATHHAVSPGTALGHDFAIALNRALQSNRSGIVNGLTGNSAIQRSLGGKDALGAMLAARLAASQQ